MLFTSNSKTKHKSEYIITRVLNAPRARVFEAFTKPEQMAQWWGPKGYKMRSIKSNIREGGLFLYSITSPEGLEIFATFSYKEIVSPDRLTFILSFCDEDGEIVRYPLRTNWPLKVLNTLTFIETEGKTILTLHAIPINSNAEENRLFRSNFSSMDNGFNGTFDQLETYLSTSINV